jgi:hypothetical protein
MKALLLFLFLLLVTGLGLLAPVKAQTAATSGRIQYEISRRVDPSQMRVMVNGQEVRPGSPDFPADIPDVRTSGMTMSFADGYGKEQREGGGMIRTVVGGPNMAPQTTALTPPFEEAVYVNLNDRAYSSVLTVKTGDQTTVYQAVAPFVKPAEGWQETNQTKKIAGYTCRKATVPFRKQTYTVWYTTELPFTYSPVKELMPEKGVVLAIESPNEQFRTAKVDLRPVKAEDVRPTQKGQVQTVTMEQLQDLRQKATADFRQRMMEERMN